MNNLINKFDSNQDQIIQEIITSNNKKDNTLEQAREKVRIDEMNKKKARIDEINKVKKLHISPSSSRDRLNMFRPNQTIEKRNITGHQVSKFIVTNVVEQSGKEVQKLDWQRYLTDNPDLVGAGIKTEIAAYHHALNHGIYNKRKMFDIEGNKFINNFKKRIYDARAKKTVSFTLEASYLEYCHSNTTQIHAFLKIKPSYLKYEHLLPNEFEELARTIDQYYSIDDLFITHKNMDQFGKLINKIIKVVEENKGEKTEVEKLYEEKMRRETQLALEEKLRQEKEEQDRLLKGGNSLTDEKKREVEREIESEKISMLLQEKLNEKSKNIRDINSELLDIKNEDNNIIKSSEMMNSIVKTLEKINITGDDVLRMFKNESGLDKITNKHFLINVHFRMGYGSSGDSIMISNIINNIIENDNLVTVLSEYNIKEDFFYNINDKCLFVNVKNQNEVVKYMDNNYKRFDILFLRNHAILSQIINKPFLDKTILYGLDVHLDGIKNLDNKYLHIFTQSDQLLDKYIDNGILKGKINVLPIIAVKYNYTLPPRQDNEIRLIYCGTLRDEENIMEIIEKFKQIHEKHPEICLKIIYGKIVDNGKGFKNKIENIILSGVNGITFKDNLNHKDACYEIATSDIGICWRKPGYGDNGEISTKIKEYEIFHKPYLSFITNYNNLVHKFLGELKEYNPHMIRFYNEIINIYKENIKFIPYVLHNALPYDNGGYAVRSHNIMKVFNNMYSDKQYIGVHKHGYPYKIHNKKKVNYVNRRSGKGHVFYTF